MRSDQLVKKCGKLVRRLFQTPGGRINRSFLKLSFHEVVVLIHSVHVVQSQFVLFQITGVQGVCARHFHFADFDFAEFVVHWYPFSI